MQQNALIQSLFLKYGENRIRLNEPMSRHTTWRVGGPADIFFEPVDENELIDVVKLSREHGVSYFILGGGANILVSDKGIRGIVIKNSIEKISIINKPSDWQDHSTGISKHAAVHFHYYDNSDNPSFNAVPIFLEVSAGYSMPHFIKDTIEMGYTGLEWFARIPGTLGGWIYNNVHGHTLFIGDFIYSVKVFTDNNEIVEKKWQDLGFGYDMSNFHFTNELILSAKIRLFLGNKNLAKSLVRDVIIKKNKYQPANSAGCVFHNLDQQVAQDLGFESNAVGYIVDKKLGWLGKQKVGGAWISQKHANFIETDGTASAKDVLEIINRIKTEIKSKYNIDIKEEIFRVGEF